MSVIHCDVEFDLKLSKDCVPIEKIDHIIHKIFIITSSKLYNPIVTLSINDNIEFL